MESVTGNIGSVVTAGSFDGVHLGHVAVVEALKREAEARGLVPTVITFDRHPLSIIAPERAPKLICTPDERDRRLRSLDVQVIRVNFSDELRRLTAREWMQLLKEKVGMQMLIIGYDHTFGSDGRGMSLDDYKRLGAEMDVEVISAPQVPGISSSAIRKAIAEGEMEKAEEMLGRPHTVTGLVVQGEHIGRTIGFPTANVNPPKNLILPGKGVYAACAETVDDRCFKSMVNIGNRPTVADDGGLTIEAHILDLNENLYGQTLTLKFFQKLRNEQRFSSLEELRQQLKKDLEETVRCGDHLK